MRLLQVNVHFLFFKLRLYYKTKGPHDMQLIYYVAYLMMYMVSLFVFTSTVSLARVMTVYSRYVNINQQVVYRSSCMTSGKF